MAEKVLFSKSVEIVPIRKGVYKDPMLDVMGFSLFVSNADDCEKQNKVRRQRKWGEDPEYDAVMGTFGTTGTAGEDIEQQLVFGWANVSVQEDGTAPLDWQGDVTDTEVLECAAYNYVLKHGIANQRHESDTECGWLVESMVFTKEKMNALGIPEGLVPEGWFVGFYIPDPAVFAKVKNKEYNMFSIEGRATRISLETDY